MWDRITDPATPKHVEAVVALARDALPRCGRVLVVAIDGHSGSGKTTLAVAVAGRLGAPCLHMDELYPGWDGLAESVDVLTARVLEPLAQGRPAAYHRWDWERAAWGERVTLRVHDLLVVEGAGCSVGSAGRYAAVRVFMDADPTLRRARGVARDGVTYTPHWARWASQEAALFSRDGTRRRADLVIDTTIGPTTV